MTIPRSFCIECDKELQKKILISETFPSDTDSLIFVTATLFRLNGGYDNPETVRDNVTNKLIEHGQFSETDISSIFDKYLIKSGDLTEPRFPTFSCDYKMKKGFCPISSEIEKFVCPDCGYEVLNIPENVTMDYSKSLICPSCLLDREDEFDNRGTIIAGAPIHHGTWITQKPEIFLTETDYFSILHQPCRKSPRDDKKGEMVVNGVWIDDERRVVLSLECRFCHARNAIKPIVGEECIIPLNCSEGVEWVRKDSDIKFKEVLFRGESDFIEFKQQLFKQNNISINWKIPRAIGSFLNSSGGSLIIGIEPKDDQLNYLNNYVYYGIIGDIQKLQVKLQNLDGYEMRISEMIKEYIGIQYKPFINVTFYKKTEVGHEFFFSKIGEDYISSFHDVFCFIDIEPSYEPVYIFDENKKNKVFLIRLGPRSQKVLSLITSTNQIHQIDDPHDIEKYIKFKWPELESE